MSSSIRIVVQTGVRSQGWVWESLRAPLASLAFHLAGILALAAWWVSGTPPTLRGSVLHVSLPSAEAAPLARPPAVDLAALTSDSATSVPSASASSHPSRVSVGPMLSALYQGATGYRSPTAEVAGLAGLLDANADGYDGAEFFGIPAGGQRFVFVVDSSRSMRGKKWRQACRELLQSVERLGPKQSFYVIFFDATPHPMFSRRKPEPDLLPATDENFKRMKHWLSSIHFGTETWPAAAMQQALSLSPDAIFLLSDGEFQDSTAVLLRSRNLVDDGDGRRKPRVPVHTVGFHSMACQASLLPIARENGGTYRFVPNPRARGFTQVNR